MQIGNLQVNNPLALGPMAGVTDWAFRTICAEAGAGITVTEMVSSRALVYQDKKSFVSYL
jgi:tRNA-dihydrouridine synthase